MRRSSLFASLALVAGMAQGTTYELDAAHSGAGFAVTHMTVSKVRGTFNSISGTAEVDEANLAASSIRVVIDAASIDTGVERRDEHLRSGDFLDAESHPEITFQSTSMEAIGDTELEVTGDLTIRGNTRQVTFPVTVLGPIADSQGGQRMGVEGELTIDRRDFGVSWSRLLDGGGLVVGDEVRIDVTAELVSAGAE